MFCVECGKEGETFDGLCAECHLAKRKFVGLPEILDVQVCGECFAVRIHKKWIDALSIEQAVMKALEDSLQKDKSVDSHEIKFQLAERDIRNYIADVEVKFKSGKFSASKNFKVQVRLKKDTCQQCGKKSGHYYEAIIQLRGPQKDIGGSRIEAARSAVLSKVAKSGAQSRNVFISKEEKIHSGYDFYLSSSTVAKSIARDLIRAFGADQKVSNSLVGRKDGQDLIRMTYLVRIPEYERGDILLMDSQYFLLRSMEGKTLSLTALDTWQESSVSLGRLSEMEIIPREGNVKEAQVLSDSGRELQILDPDTSSTVDVVKPKNFGEHGATVSIVKTKAGILLVP